MYFHEIKTEKQLLAEFKKEYRAGTFSMPDPTPMEIEKIREEFDGKISTSRVIEIWVERHDKKILEIHDNEQYEKLTQKDQCRIEYLEFLAEWKGYKAVQDREKIDKVVEEAKEEIIKSEPEVEQYVFSFMPTEMARTSPFFPMSRRDMKQERPFEIMQFDTSWGHILIKGQRLSMYDESVLLAVLSVIKKNRAETVSITPYRICQLMGVNPARDTYKAIWGAIKRLTGTYVEISVKESRTIFGTIFSGGSTGPKEDGHVTVNPYFLRTLAAGFMNVNMTFRSQLKGDLAKALYRFILSQRPNPYECHILKLARAVNLEEEKRSRLRYKIRMALKELKDKGFLYRYLVSKSDIVKVWQKKGQGLRIAEQVLNK